MAQSDRYRNARQRLADRTAAIANRTTARLRDVQADHDVTWRSLLSSQRRIGQLDAEGMAPSALEFWETEAAPSSASLVTAATLVIEGEMALLEDAVDRFRASVEPLIDDRAVAALTRSDLEAVLQPMLRGALDAEPLNEIGERWQRRLRRAATRRVLASAMLKSREAFDLVVDREEIVLLDLAPWAHGDRLLSAHEIAHSDIRALVRQRLDALAVVDVGRPRRHLDVIR